MVFVLPQQVVEYQSHRFKREYNHNSNTFLAFLQYICVLKYTDKKHKRSSSISKYIRKNPSAQGRDYFKYLISRINV